MTSARLLDVLLECEWAARDNRGTEMCPSCRVDRYPHEKHKPSCDLAEAIREHSEPEGFGGADLPVDEREEYSTAAAEG